jgi:DNA polymerase III subunit delta'
MSETATPARVDLAASAPWLATAREAIAGAHAADRLPHALLIQGIPGVGKAALAEWIARYALCDRATDDACGTCPSCVYYAAQNHPDLIRVGVEEDKKQIAVDSVREMIGALTLKSFRGRRKVAIVQPADALNVNGANALLKTLEEPSGSALLILVAVRPEKLPATIASRCQRVKIAAPSDAVARQWLDAQQAGPDWTVPLRLSAGAPLAALALADVPQVAEEMAELPQILGRGDADIPSLAERCQKHYPAERLRCLEFWVSDRIRYGLTSPAPAATGQPGPSAEVRRRHIQGLYRVLDEVRRTRVLLSSNASVALLFEQLFVSIARELDALRAATRRA